MEEYQNHLVDPTYFFDAIEEFSFNFRIFVKIDESQIDEYGKIHARYDLQTIRGSLQSQGTHIRRSKEGNTEERIYNFYCKSLYRINIGDVILYKGNYMICTDVQDYDEYGCRSAVLKMIQLTSYRDLADYVAYLKGEKLI